MRILIVLGWLIGIAAIALCCLAPFIGDEDVDVSNDTEGGV